MKSFAESFDDPPHPAQIKERFHTIEERQRSDNAALHELTRKVDLLMQTVILLAQKVNAQHPPAQPTPEKDCVLDLTIMKAETI